MPRHWQTKERSAEGRRRGRKSQRGDLDLARQFPPDRYLTVTALQDDGTERYAADDFDIGSFFETEARELTSSVDVSDERDTSSGSHRYRVDPHSRSPWG
ncbi:MAG: hypothetical protein PVI01_11450 [Gemmatimonadales bacterium]|jgi:hypothetical protein